MLGNLRIRTRLQACFGLVIVLSLLTTGLALWRLHSVATATDTMMHEPLNKERLIAEFASNTAVGVRRTAAIIKSSDPAVEAYFGDEQKLSSKRTNEILDRLNATLQSPDEKALLEKVNGNRVEFIAARTAVLNAKKNGLSAEANQQFDQRFVPSTKAMQDSVQQLLDFQEKQIDDTAKGIDDIYETSRMLLLALAGAALVCGVACAALLSNSITRPLHKAVDLAHSIAQGDLTVSAASRAKDEIGDLSRALDEMRMSLTTTLEQVRVGIGAITTASGEIADGNADLSSRTEAQAGSLEETASSMEELTQTVKQNAENARQANELVITASQRAAQGGQVVNQVMEMMGSINASSSKIVDIIGVIDGIALQTNILALNAAVEAARAGEQGRGFAVVAAEVRSLAQRSASAAKEIKTLIGDSVEKVEAGGKLVDQAGAAMTQMVDSVQRVTGIMSEIVSASDEQSVGIEEVNRAVMQMDGITQQNAALVEQAAAAAESMRDQTSHLSQAISVFKMDRQTQASSMARTSLVAREPSLVKAPAIRASSDTGRTVSPSASRSKATAPAKRITRSVATPPKSAPRVAPRPVAVAAGDDDWEQF
ncbi:methyl-accepting chemotaxis protein [Burkholderia sp. L27(2015)]|uniref:methyl-accepting chemotaxis protein n=1 Tax=Burkholderia sp. L27(2015) TaxID=1641858 RepID=UPI00131ABFAE|nr:methyl-accepting chemotaxis protein [Burkholderia sp. L27(2015)]